MQQMWSKYRALNIFNVLHTFAVGSKLCRWTAEPQLLYAQPLEQIRCLLLPEGHMKHFWKPQSNTQGKR